LISLNIEFFGDAGRIHNARFAGEKSSSNEVILGLFYENVDWLMNQIIQGASSKKEIPCDFGDFISGSISNEYITLIPDLTYISSKSYKVKTAELVDILEKWKKFKSRNRNGVVETVNIGAEIF